MRRRSVCISVFLVLALLLPTLLGCGKKAPYGPAQVHFPEDEGAHPESKMEWWYLNATVSDNEDHQYTAMLAYFRPSLKILSIADLEADAFYQEVSTIPELMVARPNYAEGGLDLRWNDYDRWYRTDESLYRYSLRAKGKSIGFSFDMVQEKEPPDGWRGRAHQMDRG